MRTLENRILAVVMAISILALAIFHQTYDFNDKKPGTEVEIVIPDGATGVQVANLLFDAGVIKSSKFYVDFYLSSASARAVAPGVHRVQSHISTKLAVAQLLDQKRISAAVKIKEGTTLSDVILELKKSKSIIDGKIAITANQIPISNKNSSLEGQIYPAIYSFEPGTPLNSAILKMLAKFKSSLSDLKLSKFDKYSPYEVLTIASMAQVEGDKGDFSKVTRVIYNRLKANMPLQLNSTVQYAANLRGRIALSTAATNINSPYNTYKHLGLPPTPISNPSADAIRAAMKPADGDWLYFITVKPGDTRFTKDYTEFQKWNTIYNNNLANGLFK